MRVLPGAVGVAILVEPRPSARALRCCLRGVHEDECFQTTPVAAMEMVAPRHPDRITGASKLKLFNSSTGERAGYHIPHGQLRMSYRQS